MADFDAGHRMLEDYSRLAPGGPVGGGVVSRPSVRGKFQADGSASECREIGADLLPFAPRPRFGRHKVLLAVEDEYAEGDAVREVAAVLQADERPELAGIIGNGDRLRDAVCVPDAAANRMSPGERLIGSHPPDRRMLHDGADVELPGAYPILVDDLDNHLRRSFSRFGRRHEDHRPPLPSNLAILMPAFPGLTLTRSIL